MKLIDENTKGVIVLNDGRIIKLMNNDKELFDDLIDFIKEYYDDESEFLKFITRSEIALLSFMSLLNVMVLVKNSSIFTLELELNNDSYTMILPLRISKKQIQVLENKIDSLLNIDVEVYRYDIINKKLECKDYYPSIKSYYNRELCYKEIFYPDGSKFVKK